jgi:hypothetical protein
MDHSIAKDAANTPLAVRCFSVTFVPSCRNSLNQVTLPRYDLASVTAAKKILG